jgi:hypothetical protein
MNQFNEKFYTLLDQGNNVMELLKMCKSPGIKINIEKKVEYIIEIVYSYYEFATKIEKAEINKLLNFINKQMNFDNVSYTEFEEAIFYKQQLDYLEEDFYNERDDRTCIFGYNCEYECEGACESFY